MPLSKFIIWIYIFPVRTITVMNIELGPKSRRGYGYKQFIDLFRWRESRYGSGHSVAEVGANTLVSGNTGVTCVAVEMELEGCTGSQGNDEKLNSLTTLELEPLENIERCSHKYLEERKQSGSERREDRWSWSCWGWWADELQVCEEQELQPPGKPCPASENTPQAHTGKNACKTPWSSQKP